MFGKVKRNYYCLVAGLQDIELDTHKLHFNQKDLKEYLKEEIHEDEYPLIEKLYLPHDNYNLINLLQKSDKPFNEKGNFSAEELETQIKDQSDLPSYMIRFIEAFTQKDPVYPELSPENELSTLFYEEMLSDDNEFTRWWYEMEMNIRNILAGLNCRKYSLNPEHHVIGDNDVANNIRKSHSKDFALGSLLDYTDKIIEIGRNDDIQNRELAFDKFKWDQLEEYTFFEYFTVERVMAFVLKTSMIERWISIDKEEGREMFKKLIEELKKSYGNKHENK